MPKKTFSLHEGRPLLDIASYGRRGPGRDHLTPAEIEHISRTVRRVPEVMVKVSGGGTSSKAVAAHLKYIDRRGELEIETDDGETLRGRGVEKELVEEWDLDTEEADAQSPYSSKPGRKPAKLVHNIILSMPPGTPSGKLLAAVKDFAREEFALKHRYAVVLHTDEPHPHVHMVVKAVSEQGDRLNVRKAMLRDWRAKFAHHLRDHGVPANATERAVRGQYRIPKLDGIYRASVRGASTHMRERAEAVAEVLSHGTAVADVGSAKLRNTRASVADGWRTVSKELALGGHESLSRAIYDFLGRMPAAASEHELLAHEPPKIAPNLRTTDRQVSR